MILFVLRSLKHAAKEVSEAVVQILSSNTVCFVLEVCAGSTKAMEHVVVVVVRALFDEFGVRLLEVFPVLVRLITRLILRWEERNGHSQTLAVFAIHHGGVDDSHTGKECAFVASQTRDLTTPAESVKTQLFSAVLLKFLGYRPLFP